MTTTAPDQHHPALAEAPARLLHDPAVRSGIKFGTAAVLALFVSELIRLESPQWSVITVIVLMPAQFTGAVAEKAFFRLMGTICGGVTGYVITASLEQNPLLFLGMVTLSVAFGIMMFGQSRAPYAFFLFALTVTVVAANGMGNPGESWSVALARTEEVFVGILASVVVSSLLWPRFARTEFRQLLSVQIQSQVSDLTRALDALVCGRLPACPIPFNPGPMRNLVHFGSRESTYFHQRLPTYSALVSEVCSLSAAVRRLHSPRTIDPIYKNLLSDNFSSISRLLAAASASLCGGQSAEALRTLALIRAEYLAALARVVEVGQDASLVASLPAARAFDISAILLEISEALDHLEAIAGLVDSLPEAPQTRSRDSLEPASAPMDPFWITNGLRCGLTVAVALVIQNWLNPPGGAMITLAAFVFSGITRLYPGGQGDRAALQYSAISAIGGIFFVLMALLVSPVLSDYAAFNTVLFAMLFLFGYLSFPIPGFSFTMQLAMLVVIGTVSLNPQDPVTFQQIIGVYLGIVLGMLVSALMQRFLWPVLPQRELLLRFSECLRHCQRALHGKFPPNETWRRLRISILPAESRSWLAAIGGPQCTPADLAALENASNALGNLGDEVLSIRSTGSDAGFDSTTLHDQLAVPLEHFLHHIESAIAARSPAPAETQSFSRKLQDWRHASADYRQRMSANRVPPAQRFKIYGHLDRLQKAAEASLSMADSLNTVLDRPCLADNRL